MAKHIGIVACSPEGSALCYRDIFRYAGKHLGEHAAANFPVVTLHNLPLEKYMRAVHQDNWHTVAEMLVQSARALAACGADFAIVPDNLMQHGVELARSASPLAWLTMTDLVTEAIVADGRRCVGLVGTKLVMYGSTYQTHLGIRGVRVDVPDSPDADAVDAIIFGELIYGDVLPESAQRLIGVIERLKAKGCEGVVLASTEVPLLIDARNSPLPVYDSSQLLAEGALRVAMGEKPMPVRG